MKTNRKTFIKTSALAGLAVITGGIEPLTAAPVSSSSNDLKPSDGKFTLPPLGYAYNSLEPFIDATTMEIHYSKHHQAYVNKLNEALAKEASLQNRTLEDLLKNLSSMPASVKTAIKNHGGGHWNHTFFWKSLKTGTQMGPKFSQLATASFGSIETMKATFEKVAMGVFGSGWVWLILQNGSLKISATANQDNPLMDSAKEPAMMPTPVLGIDLWEHAYYLKHQNRRADYVSGFWNVVNWDEIERVLS